MSEESSFKGLTHGNYHSWKLRACGRLKKHGVWGVVEGYDSKPRVPEAPHASNADAATAASYACAKRELRAWRLRDERARGILIDAVDDDQELRHIAHCTSAKDIWDTLRTVHEASLRSGLAAFYIMAGILQKKYAEGESMQRHIDHMLCENSKLAVYGKKAFDDEFMAQVLLISLPRPSLYWETITVALLHSATDEKPLNTRDVSSVLQAAAARNMTGSAMGTSGSVAKKGGKPKRKY